MTHLLAWVPFLDPANVFHDWWFVLIVPLAFGVSVIHKAVRMDPMERYWRQVTVMTTQIVAAMIALAILLAVFELWIMPHLPVMRP
jgi:cytochrome c biogenesis protein ResB